MYEYSAKLIRVIDGDTVDCTIDLGFDIHVNKRVRLAGINAPESRTKNLEEKKRGLEAKERVIELLMKENNNNNDGEFVIRTEYDRSGKYGRVIGTIILLPSNESLNDMLVSEGHAVKKDYSK